MQGLKDDTHTGQEILDFNGNIVIFFNVSNYLDAARLEDTFKNSRIKSDEYINIIRGPSTSLLN